MMTKQSQPVREGITLKIAHVFHLYSNQILLPRMPEPISLSIVAYKASNLQQSADLPFS